MNWLEPASPCLITNGVCIRRSAHLDIPRQSKEDMVQIEILITVGYLVTCGFQIGKGVWEGDWKDPNCSKQKET